MIEICTVGGYNEVGKNMTAVKVGKEVVILDLGIHIESYIKFTEDEDIINIDPKELIAQGAAPDISKIKDWKKNVVAVVPTHAHLDHVGAIPFLSDNFDAPILCTPYTAEVIKSILKNEKIQIKNDIKTLNTNAIFHISENLQIEFINVTHSTPQTVMVALHTKEGVIIYANDFKFDSFPTLGRKPNYPRLKQLGKKGVLVLIVDSTYAADAKKTPSESVAKEMLRDVLLGCNSDGKAIIITTFSSHIARLKSIIEYGKKLGRKIVFLGRSLARYVEAAENIGLVNFSKDVEIIRYGKHIKKKLKAIQKEGREKYIIVVTGHQGEPKATLTKMVDKKLGFDFNPEDHIIFSCKVIPSPTNIENRKYVEKELKNAGVRIFKDIHVSGHAAREDLRDLINLVKPKHIIPAHGDFNMTSAMNDLANDMGYKPGKQVHVMKDGDRIKL